MTALDVLGEVLKFPCQRVILTGGEPMLNDLWPLQRLLKARGYTLSVETNGTVAIPDGLLDWVCVSPKDQVYPNLTLRQLTGNELKCVYVGQPLSMYDTLVDGFDHLFLQPLYDESATVEENGASFSLTESVVKNNPPWRLSLQTHKWMGVD